MMKKAVFVFWIFLYVGGCGVAIVPKPDQGGEVDLQSYIVTKKVGQAKVSVQTHEWKFNPAELDQYYTPFLLLIKNETDHKLDFSQKSLFLVDNRENQFQPVPPLEVERTFIDRGYRLYPSAQFGFGSGGHSSFFGLGFEIPLSPATPPASDISLLALHEGEILPGASIRGFVYFRKISAEATSLKLHVELDRASEDFYFILRK